MYGEVIFAIEITSDKSLLALRDEILKSFPSSHDYSIRGDSTLDELLDGGEVLTEIEKEEEEEEQEAKQQKRTHWIGIQYDITTNGLSETPAELSFHVKEMAEFEKTWGGKFTMHMHVSSD